jgi:serine protease
MSRFRVTCRPFVLSMLLLAPAAAAAEIDVPCKDPIPGRYIVVLADDSFRSDRDLTDPRPALGELARAMTALHGGRPGFEYRHAAPGFSVEVDARGADRFARDPRVERVEQVCPIYLSGTQSSAPWGLDRVDQSDRPLNTTYTYQETGAGVHLYIIDSGISSSNAGQLGTRLKTGKNFVPGIPSTNTTDCYGADGHGTAVAAIAAGATYGVAKSALVYPYRIFGCSGDGSTEIARAAVDWLIDHHQAPAVANMSWWYSPNSSEASSLEESIASAIEEGIVVVASANNHSLDACGQTPSRIPEVVTVGATNASDVRATFGNGKRSNFGTCVDLWAPGHGLPAINKNGGAWTVEGTSFAAPAVTGAAALYLQTNPSHPPATVAHHLAHHATPGVLSDLGAGSPNLLLFAKPAHACVAWSCNPLTRNCSFDLSCSRMALDLGYYYLQFGDGTSYWGAGASVNHTYPANSNYSISLGLVPWYAETSSVTACVRVASGSSGACTPSGLKPWR